MERRKDLVKLAKKIGEETKIAIRNTRRDSNETLKQFEKDKEISKDELKKGQEQVQKLTDDFSKQVDELVDIKSKEIMTI